MTAILEYVKCKPNLDTLRLELKQKVRSIVYSGVPNKRAARLLILKEIFPPTWPY